MAVTGCESGLPPAPAGGLVDAGATPPVAAHEPTSTATPAPPVASTPTATSAPTATATPFAAPRPTAVVVNLSSPTPTDTPTPSPSPTPSPTPTPPPPSSPLTGLPGPAEALARRIVAVKIDNAPEARPQSGLSEAEVVYEHLTEGIVTRYTAFFQASVLKKVGPVRSARFVDRDLAPQFDALLAHVGGSPHVLRDLMASPVADMDQFYYEERLPYYRDPRRVAPFNMYLDLAALREFGARRHPQRRQVPALAFYREAPPPGNVTSITLPAGPRDIFQATYTYDAAQRRWKRALGGQRDVDEETGAQLQVENVIVQHVSVVVTAFEEDSLGNRSLAIATVGTGKAIVFRDGLRLEGRWSRPSVNDATSFATEDGTPLLLRPGLSWVHLRAGADRVESA